MYYNNRIGKDSRLLNRVIGQSIDGQVAFKDLRKFHYNILCRSEMKESGAEVLAGRAKSVSAKYYLLNEIDRMTEQYHKAWKNLTSDSRHNPLSSQLKPYFFDCSLKS
jgi:intergrase/recombinase